MKIDHVNRAYVVEWCSSGKQFGQFNVTTIGDILRVNMQVFSGMRAAKYNEMWIIVGAFEDAESAHTWANKLREIQESGQVKRRTERGDDRLVPPPTEDAFGMVFLIALPYESYLKTEYWQDVRKEVLRRANYRCQVCNGDKPLDVHHRTYESRGHERESDVIALCRDCHAKFHGKNI